MPDLSNVNQSVNTVFERSWSSASVSCRTEKPALQEPTAVKLIVQKFRQIYRDESGSTAIEYALIASFMGIMLLPATQLLSGTIINWYQTMIDYLDTF